MTLTEPRMRDTKYTYSPVRQKPDVEATPSQSSQPVAGGEDPERSIEATDEREEEEQWQPPRRPSRFPRKTGVLITAASFAAGYIARSLPGMKRPRAFVCITGQLPRLELQNKIDNLFMPFHSKYRVRFDVALILSDTDHRSVKSHAKGSLEQKYFSVEEAADELSSVPGVTVLNRDLDVQSKDPVINEHYLEQRSARGDKEKKYMGPERKAEEVRNHVRQFESLAKCFPQMLRTGNSYDLVHRIRDDTGYFRPVDYREVLNLTHREPMSIVATDCTQHGGMNDRGAFVSPDASYDYFVHPILHMYTMPLPPDVDNTEKYLKATYKRTCKVWQSNKFDLFHLWDGPNGTKHFFGEDLICMKRKGLIDP